MGWALLLHRGRRSGRAYRTPISVFVRDRTAVIALTYGSGCDWAQNVLAAGGCSVITRGRRLQLVHPRVVTGSQRGTIPAPARAALRVLRVDEYLQLEVVGEPR